MPEVEPAPPQNVWPAVLPLQQVLYHDPGLHAVLTHAFVYQSGCSLFLSLRADVSSLDDQRHIGQLVTDHGEIAAPLTVAVICGDSTIVADLGVDSAKTTTFYRSGASGSGQFWQLQYWLSPLPQEGFEFTVAAPTLSLPVSRTLIDAAALLRAAALSSTQLWPLEREEHSYQGLT